MVAQTTKLAICIVPQVFSLLNYLKLPNRCRNPEVYRPAVPADAAADLRRPGQNCPQTAAGRQWTRLRHLEHWHWLGWDCTTDRPQSSSFSRGGSTAIVRRSCLFHFYFFSIEGENDAPTLMTWGGGWRTTREPTRVRNWFLTLRICEKVTTKRKIGFER